MPKRTEFAPGLPSKGAKKAIPSLKSPEFWEFTEHRHKAKRAGQHSDIRLSDGRTAFSWASRKGLPAPGNKTLLTRQPDHTPAYMKFRGTIKEGYGAGEVERARNGPVKIRKSGPGEISLTLLDSKNPQEYKILRMPKYGKDSWLMMNHTPMASDKDDLAKGKPSYREAKVSELPNYFGKRYAISSKLDGAHVEVDFGDKVRLFSHTPSKSGELINHSYTVGIDELPVPAALKGTKVRAELIGMSDGKVIPQRELGGLMNASPAKAMKVMRDKGIDLKVAPFRIDRIRGIAASATPYRKQLKVLKSVVNALPGKAIMPDVALSTKAKERLIAAVKNKRHPLTQEGLIAWPLDEAGATPVKIKFKEHTQVYIVEVFPMTSKGEPVNLAGGFSYSLKPGGKPVGRVGTGFNRALRKELWESRKAMKNRKVIISSTDQYPSGAYRAPSFISFHL